MRQLLIFIRKEFYHVLRDPRTLVLLFAIPLVLVFIFGYALNNEIKDAKIAILDNAKDLHSRQITTKILSSGYFQLYRNLSSYAQVEDAFRDGKVKVAFVFPQGFSEQFEHSGNAQIDIVGDATDPNTATTLINYASSIVRDYQIEQSQLAQVPMVIIPMVRMVYNPGLRAAYGFVPGVIVLVLMLISAMMTSITLAREKEFGNMEILLISPLRPYQIIFGKVMPYLLLSVINTCMLLFLGIHLFDVPMVGNWFLLGAECILFIITALSLGILISTEAETQMAAMFTSMISLLMPTMLLSGFIFPLESMPYPMQVISNAIPAKWFMIIVKDIMLKGSGLDVIWKPTLILLGMTTLFIGLSIKNFKNRIS